VQHGLLGTVFRASNLANANHQLVVKVGHTGLNHHSLEHEHRVLSLLHGVYGIPQLLWFGLESGHNVLVLPSLGPSLEDVFNVCGQTFSPSMTAVIAD